MAEINLSTMSLVITEKPSVAQSVARVVGADEKKEGYMEGNGYLVTWCIGHLVELAPPGAYSEEWKKWRYESLPMIPQEWKTEVKKGVDAQYRVVKSLMHKKCVGCIVNGCDAGREGELIFRLVYHQAGCSKPVKRLWISSLEESAIREGLAHLKPGSDYDNLYQSALCRQRADWLVGINATRLFTSMYGGKLLRVGRVQTPALAMLAEREEQIRNFQKEKYYVVHLISDGLEAASGRIDDKSQAEGLVEGCRGGQAFITSVVKEKKTAMPPKLYDLTTLQREANRFFGFTAKQTLEYAQSLYEKKLATYPRTDSQFLSDDMEQTARCVAKAIFQSILSGENVIFQPDVKRVMDSRKVTDHHAIIPTAEIAKTDLELLPGTERKILSLIACRLLCATGEKHLYETVRAELSCNGYTFVVSGKSAMQTGWKYFENLLKHSFQIPGNQGKGDEEKKLPEWIKGQVFDGVQTEVSEHFTTSPKHYTEDSLLSALERAGAEDVEAEAGRKGLGTPATRADIIEKLVKDGFVRREKRQMIPTERGMKLIAVLPDVVKSPKLTADWENALTLVARGELLMEDFMADIENMVSELIQANYGASDRRKKMFAKEGLGNCPNCGCVVVKGKYGAYCVEQCGMNVSRVLGVALTDMQIRDLLAGKKILLKGLKSRAEKAYDAYIIPKGTEEYHYTKDGEEKNGIRYKFTMEFPERKYSGGKQK